ncbi:MAG: hypothetical protein IT559_08080 [Alphaproteobacteria bacterium]|nr:hypothetical protein [Alphaproteobacteria bacterium]
MNKYMMIAAAALVVAAAPAYVAFQANAEDAAHGHVAAEAAADAAVEVQEVTLADGTKVHVKGEEVFVVDAEGTETPAPDGVHTLADGTTLETLGGKVVVPAAEDAAH